MDKIILEISTPGAQHPQLLPINKTDIRIGRGYDNDVIIDDLYADPMHAVLACEAGNWTCEDRSSLNGTFLARDGAPPAKIIAGIPVPVRSGDILTIGQTVIRLISPSDPVPPAIPLTTEDRTTNENTRIPAGQMILVLSCFYGLGYYILNLSNRRNTAPILNSLAEETLVLIGFAIWSGLWALITRFSRRRHRFAEHFFLICRFSIAITALNVIGRFLNFYLCNQLTDNILQVLLLAASSTAIINWHLKIATRLSSPRRLLTAGLVTLPLCGVLVLSLVGSREAFDPDPNHYFALTALPRPLIPTDSIDQTIRHLDTIFK